MFDELILKFLKKLKSKNPEAFNYASIRNIPKVKRKLNKVYKKLLFWDEVLELLYGIDSQILMEYKDMLNAISLDKDRPDTNIKAAP